MLIYISVFSISATLLLLIVLYISHHVKLRNQHPMEKELIKRRKDASNRSGSTQEQYKQFFEIYNRIPIVKSLMLQLMTRFSILGEKDQEYLRRKVINIMTGLLGVYAVSIVVFWQITHNVLYLCVFIFFLWYIAGSYLDFFVAQGHLRLLEQMISFIGLVRQKYYEHGMIDDAIYEATLALDEKDREMAVHGELMYDILISSHHESMVERYNETAPNPFLKMFLSLAYMTMEYGDQKVDGQWVFLSNLSFLTKNIHLEIEKRKRLNYALQSMNVIVLIPLLCMSLIKNWAVSNFPPLAFFYRSPTGKYIEVITIFLMLVSMTILNKIQRVDSTELKQEWFKGLLTRIKVPLPEHRKIKWVYGIVTFLVVMMIFASVQWNAKTKLREIVYYESQFLGTALDEETLTRRATESRIDYPFIKENAAKMNLISSETAKRLMIQTWIGNATEKEREDQILEKVKLYQSYYIRFWHIFIAFCCSVVAYNSPEINNKITKKVREMDIDDEIAGFRSIIMMLMHHPRMNVEELLLWLESYGIFYKEELHRCLLNLASGESKAVMECHQRVEHKEMRRILYQLAMASEDIQLEEAFDELIQEKNTFFEQRKWQNEKLIQRKMIMGQNIGFLPAYSLIILYMIVPMIMASTSELNRFFSVLQ